MYIYIYVHIGKLDIYFPFVGDILLYKAQDVQKYILHKRKPLPQLFNLQCWHINLDRPFQNINLTMLKIC